MNCWFDGGGRDGNQALAADGKNIPRAGWGRTDSASGRNYGIHGKLGHICLDGDGFLLCVTAKDELDQSPRRWTNVKQRLAFCRIMQDGDDEGCLHLDRLPTPAEAVLIREALRIKRKRRHTPDQLASITARLRKNATRDASKAHTFVKTKKAARLARTD